MYICRREKNQDSYLSENTEELLRDNVKIRFPYLVSVLGNLKNGLVTRNEKGTANAGKQKYHRSSKGILFIGGWERKRQGEPN